MCFSEETIKEAIKAFKGKQNGDGKGGPFYTKDYKWDFQKDSDDLFQNAVWQGYLDAKRTFSGISKKSVSKETSAFINLAKAIKKYFNEESSNFDHRSWCENFITDLQEEYKATYGQAQKVVNMTFKYLFCHEGSEEKREKFTPCHMALDGYILEWYKKQKNRNTEYIKKVPEWSKIDDYKTYQNIQTDISNLTIKYGNMSVIEKEFIIWENVKNYRELSNIKNFLHKYKDKGIGIGVNNQQEYDIYCSNVEEKYKGIILEL